MEPGSFECHISKRFEFGSVKKRPSGPSHFAALGVSCLAVWLLATNGKTHGIEIMKLSALFLLTFLQWKDVATRAQDLTK